MKCIVTGFLFSLFLFGFTLVSAQPFGKEYVLGASTTWQVIKPTLDGNLIAVGDYTASNTLPNIIMITKLKPDGAVLWSKTYGGDIQQNGLNITETTNGSFVIAGAELIFDINTGEFTAKGCIIKLSDKGEKLWSRYLEYGNQNYFVLSHVAATEDGGVIAGGSFQQFTGGSVASYAYVAKMDTAGAIMWAKQFDTKGYRRWIANISCSNRVVTVVSESSIANGNSADDAAAITFMNEEDGNVMSAKRFRLSGSKIHFIQTASPAADGGVVVSGTTGNGIGAFDIWTFKVNYKLDLQWSQVINQGAYDRPNQMISKADGVTLIGAVSSNADNYFNPYLIWIDSNGAMLKNQLLPQPGRGVFGIATVGKTTYSLLNQEFGTGGNAYTNLYAWPELQGICSASAQAGNWKTAPDVITDNRKTPVAVINTVVSDMSYTVADVPLTVNNICSVLPLQMLSFTGAFSNGSVVLNWQTANESNTQFFTVEKSSDAGIHYTHIGTVTANGSGGYAYTFTDNNVLISNALYRITTMDKNGAESYSNSIVVTLPLTTMWMVYPNPVRNKVTLQMFLSKETSLQMTILNTTGQTVLQQKIAGGAGVSYQTFDVSKLRAGVYYIHITGGNAIKTLRFEKQ